MSIDKTKADLIVEAVDAGVPLEIILSVPGVTTDDVAAALMQQSGRYIDFLRETLPKSWTVDAPHIRLITDHLDAALRGEIDRLAFFMPPRHGKSETITYRFPLRWMELHPGANALVTGYNERFARKFGRRTRNIAKSRGLVSNDKAAADEWEMTTGGLYMARGVGSPPTGTGFGLISIDDPIRRREDAESEIYREKVWDWYTDDLYTRLEPGGVIILVMCMVGDTLVLMEDGTQRALRDVRPGNRIASYHDGKVVVSTVRNWANHGPDRVYEIRMKSGITVKANARHPFLVETNRGPEWHRTATLKKGTNILRVIGVNGEASRVPQRDVKSLLNAKAYACPTTTNTFGHPGIDHLQLTPSLGGKPGLSTDTKSMLRNTTACLFNKTDFARSANVHQLRASTRALIGGRTFASIIATIAEKSELYSATSATLPLVTAKQRLDCSPPLNTCEIIADTVLEIVDAGVEDVFDIEVEHTANFIANGLISHNTLWHEDDLGARAIASEPGRWTIVKLPAIAEDTNDALGRMTGEALWPDRFSAEELFRRKAVMSQNEGERSWNALYQQRPSAPEGDFFKVSKINYCDANEVPTLIRECRAWDTAATANAGDWTVGTRVGMSYDNRVFVTDMARSQWSTDDVDANILTTAKIDGHQVPIHIPEDPGSAGKKSSSAFVRMLVGFDVTTERMSGSKPTRAKPFSSQLNAGNVWFVRAWWNSAAKEELRTFPNGKHDDIVDSLADGFNVVADVFEPIGAPPSATCGPSPTTHGNRPVTAVPSEDGNFIVRAPMRTRRLR